MTQILGQENGSKKEQLSSSVTGGYAETHILMIGDAPGDLEAVQKVNGLFYPIIPGKEIESWKNLLEEGMQLFIEERYAGAYQEQLILAFQAVLN